MFSLKTGQIWSKPKHSFKIFVWTWVLVGGNHWACVRYPLSTLKSVNFSSPDIHREASSKDKNRENHWGHVNTRCLPWAEKVSLALRVICWAFSVGLKFPESVNPSRRCRWQQRAESSWRLHQYLNRRGSGGIIITEDFRLPTFDSYNCWRRSVPAEQRHDNTTRGSQKH